MDATLGQARKLLELFEGTSRERIQELLASGLLADLRDGNIAKVDRDAFRRFVGLQPLSPPLLEVIGTVTVPAAIERFIARERFVLNHDLNAKPGVSISFLGNNFKSWFLEKIEEPAPETLLRYAKLGRYSVDGPIMAELGDKAETTLAQIWAFMERQPNGGAGVLLTNGWTNIFYVRDANGERRAVGVGWGGGGWSVGAGPVADLRGWGDGGRVFSRNS